MTPGRSTAWESSKSRSASTSSRLRYASQTWTTGTPAEQRNDRRSWKAAAVAMKQRQLDSLREEDQRRIAKKVEHGKALREERFQRLVAGLSEKGDVAEVGLELRKIDAQEQLHRQSRHTDWEQSVFEPIQEQLLTHFNGPTRAELQQLHGSRSVDFVEPHEEDLYIRVGKDPLKRELLEHAKEEAFDREAKRVLGGKSHSAPDLRSTWAPGTSLSRARSRQVLDATEWGQLKLQAQPCGRFAQIVELGPGFRMGKAVASPPWEADGVPAAGKRTVRAGPRSVAHGDSGLFRDGAWAAALGEAAKHKTWHGASSGAPAQDHYTFATGPVVTDIEFPLGKRLFSRWP